MHHLSITYATGVCNSFLMWIIPPGLHQYEVHVFANGWKIDKEYLQPLERG